ncbi:Cyclin-D4-1 [Acorus gramineus]|uniref:Cyclin-D4-1 n=1 Tax=Acorus gramineus TaxID=55184 RepID=A0AAV9AHC8_ACOGR|nr:Cyclin-D4-1 [Acorus gramineus]
MSPSYDSASSILLCSEDNSSMMGFDEDADGAVEESLFNGKLCFYGDPMTGLFPKPTEESLGLLLGNECEHRPREDYLERLRSGSLDLSVRREAVDWILKVHAHYSFGPLSAYLSVNYLDRFLSLYEIPQGKAWMTQLLSVACLSLAAKMDETEVPLSLDLQVGECKYVFEARTIQRMELLVLSTLKWRMQSVTPFSFIDYFLHHANGGESRPKLLISRSVELTLSTIRAIEFLEFRPSEVAAAVAISVTGEVQAMDMDMALSNCIHVQKERMMKCCGVMKDMGLIRDNEREVKSGNGMASTSVPQSPIGVLEANTCLSYKSDYTTTVGSQQASSQTSPAKKRKTNSLSNS